MHIGEISLGRFRNGGFLFGVLRTLDPKMDSTDPKFTQKILNAFIGVIGQT